jgi:hypothetical protein
MRPDDNLLNGNSKPKNKLRKRLCSLPDSLFAAVTGGGSSAKKSRLKSCDQAPFAPSVSSISRPASSLGSVAGSCPFDHCDFGNGVGMSVESLVSEGVPKTLYRHNLAFFVASSKSFCNGAMALLSQSSIS